MFCTHCGKEIDDSVAFCPYCGYAVYEEDVEELNRMHRENRRKPSVEPEEKAAAGRPQGGGRPAQGSGRSSQPAGGGKKGGYGIVLILAIVAVCLLALLFYIGANVVRGIRLDREQEAAEQKAAEAALTEAAQKQAAEDDITLIPQEEERVTDTPTATPTDTPMPTVTPTPSNTPVPTATPTPTLEPLPTDTPVPEVTATPIPAASQNGYVIANSNSAYISASSLSGLSDWELKVARNEIYARHGRKFKDSALQNYFNSQSWYKGTIEPDAFDSSVLNDYERENAETIKKVEAGR